MSRVESSESSELTACLLACLLACWPLPKPAKPREQSGRQLEPDELVRSGSHSLIAQVSAITSTRSTCCWLPLGLRRAESVGAKSAAPFDSFMLASAWFDCNRAQCNRAQCNRAEPSDSSPKRSAQRGSRLAPQNYMASATLIRRLASRRLDLRRASSCAGSEVVRSLF